MKNLRIKTFIAEKKLILFAILPSRINKIVENNKTVTSIEYLREVNEMKGVGVWSVIVTLFNRVRFCGFMLCCVALPKVEPKLAEVNVYDK